MFFKTIAGSGTWAILGRTELFLRCVVALLAGDDLPVYTARRCGRVGLREKCSARPCAAPYRSTCAAPDFPAPGTGAGLECSSHRYGRDPLFIGVAVVDGAGLSARSLAGRCLGRALI